MWIYWLVASGVGVAMVVQNGINREISKTVGLPAILVINSVFTLLMSLVFFGISVWKPEYLSANIRGPGQPSLFPSWGAFLAAVCGFSIISGMPVVLGRLGALRALALVIAVQLVVGLIWDASMEQLPISPQRLIGAGVTFIGAFIALKG